jgi:subtilisin family serine protease
MRGMGKQLLPLFLAVVACQATVVEGGSAVTKLKSVSAFGHDKAFPKALKTKAGSNLMALHSRYQPKVSLGSTKNAAAFKVRNTKARVKGDKVAVEFTASGDAQQLAADLRRLGATNLTVFGRKVSGNLAIKSIPALDSLSTLQFARPSYAATRAGVVTTQGDGALLTDIGRTLFNVDGSGVKVGVLSDSFNCFKNTLRGAEAGFFNNDLPPDVVVLEDFEGCEGAGDEGRAMMEIIHDVAPGAALSFHTAFNGEADFAQGIIDLANDGADIIVDDVGYFNEPFFQDGIIAQAVDTVKAMGVAYFSAAGNSARMSYESAFRSSGRFIDLGLGDGPQEAHDFDPGPGTDICQKVTIPLGASLILAFQWDQPYFSVSGAPGSASDMDIVLTDASCKEFITESTESNIGGDPFEILFFDNLSEATAAQASTGTRLPWPAPPDPEPDPNSTNQLATFGVMILHYAGPKPTLMKTLNYGSTTVDFKEFDTQSSTSVGHSIAAGGLGVGAVRYSKTPEFGVRKPRAEPFSSAGASPILFDLQGNRLSSPVVRQQPAIMAPDGVDTSFFGGEDSDNTTLPNFFGTSAAAPHAAGLAALLKELTPTLTPGEMYGWMKASALDMDDLNTKGFDKGFDFGTGFGLIHAVADFTVTKIKVSKTAKGASSATQSVDVTIQNRSPYSETITAADLGDGINTGLVRLNVNVIDDDDENCTAAQVSFNPANTLVHSKTLKPKQSIKVKYLVSYHCAEPATAKGDPTPGDYSHTATVHHETLGILDANQENDACPRSVNPPFKMELLPDGKVKDKGCGTQKTNKTFGDPVTTNVIGG